MPDHHNTHITTTTLSIGRDKRDDAALDRAAEVLRRGGLVAFPTETVYGLGADATNPDAVARIFAAKGRPATNPLIVHGPDIFSVQRAVSAWPPAASRLAERFWPGPLTLVLPRSQLVADAVSAGMGTVGIRIPDVEAIRSLLSRAGVPVAAPSANRSTGVSPTTARHVLNDLDGRIDLVLDGGPTRVGIESTVVDLTTERPRILRPGAITAGQLRTVLGRDVDDAPRTVASELPQTSPGQTELHYAPRTPLRLISWRDVDRWIVSMEGPTVGLLVLGPPDAPIAGTPAIRVDWPDPVTAARELYAELHRMDERGLAWIYVVGPPETDAWRAVGDRLWRASRRWAREGAGG